MSLVFVFSISRAANPDWWGGSDPVGKAKPKVISKIASHQSRGTSSFKPKAFAGRTLYWINGKGNWADPKHWSESNNGPSAGRTPTLEDDVVFTEDSFGAPPYNEVDLGADRVYCRNITFIDSRNEGVLFNGTIQISGSSDFTGAGEIRCQLLYYSDESSHNTVTSGAKCVFRGDVIFLMVRVLIPFKMH